MPLPKIDHLILLVDDLDRASADIAAQGFTVQERADTKHGTTRFRFVTFEEGSYILITAFTSSEAAAGHRLGPVLEKGNGWADYSFVVADLDTAAARGAAAGTVLGPVHDVSNVVASGEKWGLRLLVAGHGALGDDSLPFLIQDVVGRTIRIPPPVPHTNGALGVAEIRIAAADPEGTATRLAALLGLAVARGPKGEPILNADACTVRILANVPGARQVGGLTSVVLRCSAGARPKTLEGPAVHYAQIELRPE